MNRVLRVAQVQLTTYGKSFGWPVVILGISFLFNLLFFASIGDDLASEPITYGVVSIYIFQAILCAQVMTQGFSFAVGLNVTRRTFFAASSLVIGVQSIVYGVMLYGLTMVESATGGWGIGMRYFGVLPATQGYSPLAIVVFTVPMLLFSFLGLWLGVISKRWGANGILWLSLVSLVTVGSVVVLITWFKGWPAVGDWIASQSALGLAAGWVLLPLALLVAGSYGLTRRAVP